MKIVDRFNPNQLVPVAAPENTIIRMPSGKEVPRFIILAIIKDDGDVAYCLWDHVRQQFYINWFRHKKFAGRPYQYMEELTDAEFKDALKMLVREKVIVERQGGLITPGATITYEIHPSMFIEPDHDSSDAQAYQLGLKTRRW